MLLAGETRATETGLHRLPLLRGNLTVLPVKSPLHRL